ncbi:MAG: M13 family metallopeptidase [Bdellovibrionaceae bacterium]|nr:M13 family metallopeptidase [Pseudobdellovibrionaceae bacterium]
MSIFINILALVSLSFGNLTKQDLLKGSPVPEKRNYELSKKVSACEDFHRYVCSEVEDKFKLPADRERWSFSFTDNRERILHAKKQFFNNMKNYTPPSDRELQFKNVYLACMDKKSAAAEEKAFVKEEMARLNAIKETKDLMALSISRIGEGYQTFSNFVSVPNKENPLRYDAMIGAGMKTLPERSYYENKDVTKDYRKILVEFFKIVKADKPEQRADWVLQFETDYALKTPLPRDMRGRISEKRDISRKDLLAKYPNIGVSEILAKVPEKTNFVDIVPEANAFMNSAVTEMPVEQLKSVYMFHSINDYMDDAYPEFYKKFFDFRRKHLGGPKQRPPRQEECTEYASGRFGMEVDKGLLEVLFPNFPQEKAIELGERVRSSIVKGLEENKWLSSSTRKEAIKKIKASKLFLVKPQNDSEWDFMPVEKYSTDKHYANQVLFSKTAFNKKLKEMAEDRNPNRWSMSPLTVNAYYSGIDNKFVLPMGILQYPFFDGASSDVENLAAMGAVVGHELGHGIDDQGSKYDFSGKVRQWFSEKDLKEFQTRGAQFVDQFNKIGHDGKLTLGENIGDHVGISFSFNAAFPDPAKATLEDKQKFFAAYARNWCLVQTKETAQRLLKTDPHANGAERINQQVIHMPAFYEAYNCKEGDKMYRASGERIRVW